MKKLLQKTKKEGKSEKKEDKQRVDEFYKTGLSHYRNNNYKNALVFFDIASENNHKDAQYILGNMYASGKGVPQNYEVAMSYYQKAAENGSVKARQNIAVCYRDGLGVEKDYKQALVWFTRAAENGDVEGQYQTGAMYMQGYDTDVPQNYEMAYLWFKVAAENDHLSAQYSMGLLYFEGKGTPQDYKQALTWFARVADKDKTGRAYNNMGHMHEKGLGVPKDFKKAMAFYLKASYKGNAMAENNIGKLYELGQGVQQNDAEAVTWYKKAAEQDNPSAQFNLGQMYLKGRPDFDPDMALLWFEKAHDGGHKDAEKFINQAIKSKASGNYTESLMSDVDSIRSGSIKSGSIKSSSVKSSSIKSPSIRSGISSSTQERRPTKLSNPLLDSVLYDTDSSRSTREGSVTISRDDYDVLKRQIQLSQEKADRAEREKREREEKMVMLMAQLELQKSQMHSNTFSHMMMSDSEDSASLQSSRYVSSIMTKTSDQFSDDALGSVKYDASLYDLLKNNGEDYEEYLAYTEDFNISGEYIYEDHKF